MCNCLSRMAGYGPESWGKHHHVNCPKYATEKLPCLFYYEEALNAWVPTPFKVDGELICTKEQLDDGEEMELRFKRFDMTDKELAEMPED